MTKGEEYITRDDDRELVALEAVVVTLQLVALAGGTIQDALRFIQAKTPLGTVKSRLMSAALPADDDRRRLAN